MKAVILNSGIGKRMGSLSAWHPKCMAAINGEETILSRQLRLLSICGINDVVITTGPFDQMLVDYCKVLDLPMQYRFVHNPLYEQTNYIYSLYLACDDADDDILLMHGDLVFEKNVLTDTLAQSDSCMCVSSTSPLPQKDFKAVVEGNRILKIGVEFFENAVTAQPLYKMMRKDWTVWLECIVSYCEKGDVNCYAEKAFNEVSDRCQLYTMDYEKRLCAEVDTPEDLIDIAVRLKNVVA